MGMMIFLPFIILFAIPLLIAAPFINGSDVIKDFIADASEFLLENGGDGLFSTLFDMIKNYFS